MEALNLKAILGIDISQYENGLKKAVSMAGTIGGGIGKGLMTAAKVGVTAIGAATTAATAFSVASVKTGMDFDKSMSQVAATMGKTMEEMANETGTATLHVNGQVKEFTGTLREFAQEMGANTAFTASQAADALNYMALAGYDTQTSMEMLPNVLNLAAAGNMDLARASDMVTDAATAMGMTLEDGSVDIDRVTLMVDEMAKAASTGNTSVEQLGDAFLTVGGLARELNGGMVELKDGTMQSVDGVQELEIAFTAMANAGIKGSEAGTHMRNMLLKLSDPTDDGVAQMEALGVSVFDAEGNMRSLKDIMGDLSGAMDNLTQQEKIQAITDLFNARDTASAEALLAAVGQDWDKIGESILDAQGAAQQMADTQLDNLSGDVTRLKSAYEGLQIAISDVFTQGDKDVEGSQGVLRDYVQFATEGLSQITTAFKQGGLSAVVPVFGEILGEGLSMIIEDIPSFIDAGIQVLSALGQGLMQNIPMIINAVTQVTTMIVQALVQGTPQLISAGIEILGALGQGIMDNLPIIIDAAVQILTMLTTAIIEALPQLLEAGIQILAGLAQGIGEALPTLIPTIVEVMLEIVQVLIDNIDLLIQGAIALMTGLATGLIQALPIVIEKLPEIVQSIVDALIQNLPLLIQAIFEMQMAIGQALIENAPALLESVAQILMMLVEAIGTGITTLVTNVGQWFSQVVQTAVTWLQQLPERAAYFAGQMVGQTINAIINLPNKIAETFNNIITSVKNFGQKLIAEGPRMANQFRDGLINIMKGIPSKMIEIGKDIVNGLKNGISNAWGSFKEWMKGLVGDFIQGVKDSLKIGSPSRVMADEIGKWIPAGIALGVENNAGTLFDSIDSLVSDIVPSINPLSDLFSGNLANVSAIPTGEQPIINVYVTLEGDADRLFRVVESKATSNYRLTGRDSLVTV